MVAERTSFDQNPDIWIDNYATEQAKLRDNIVSAQNLLSTVSIEYDLRYAVI